MKINIICFTNNGLDVAKKIFKVFVGTGTFVGTDPIGDVEVFAKFEAFENNDKDIPVNEVRESLSEWTLDTQNKGNAIVFVGAMGIAVRAIAAGVNDKLTDAPVIVVDELGQNVIPVLSGHMGGANELALKIAEGIGANPVITTATDLEGCFSVDLFAKENNLFITNRDGIAKVSAKALENRPVRLSIENYPPKDADVVITSDFEIMKRGIIGLCPKEYAVGIGCKKGSDPTDIERFVLEELDKINIRIDQVGAIASIDLKINEKGIVDFAGKYRIPFITYTAELLEKATGEYDESEFVKSKTGVGNVCERAAMLLTGNRGKIILNKTAKDGITVSIARVFNG